MPGTKLQFGPFVLDLRGYELTRSGEPVRLERIPMDLLILLTERNGALVARQEIVDRLWGHDVFLDYDNSINKAVRKIRQALGEEYGRRIETIPGKGYRFRVPEESPITPVATSLGTANAPGRFMLAILPFENLSGDANQDYFSDGLTEETIMQLGRVSPERLGVIARTSSMAYKGRQVTVQEIGKELGVDYLVEGSVRREGGRVRVTAQLIRVRDQVHVWAENYDRELSNTLALQDEVGSAIAGQVLSKLTRAEEGRLHQRQSTDEVAYDDYLRGRYHLARVTYPELRKAIGFFSAAKDRDPNFAAAYAGFADCHLSLSITSDVPPKDSFPVAEEAAHRALTLDLHSVEAHTSMGAIKFWFKWDWDGAIREFEEAIRENANYARAYLMLAHTLSNTGRHTAALEIVQHARRLDPFSMIINTMYGQFLYHAGKDAESIRQLHRTLELEPRFWVAHICLAKIFEKRKMYSDALAACDKAWQFSGGNTEALSIAGYVYAVTGQKARAEEKLHELLKRSEVRYVPPYNLALVMVGLDQADMALQWLEQAHEDRDVHMTFLRDQKWDRLRSLGKFQSLMQRMGLA